MTASLHNLYGPTEAVIDSTAETYTDGLTGATVPIGRPIDNVRTYVLDRWMNPVPIGAVGELFIGGAGVARGYVNGPGPTAERFVPDPFGVEAGSRLYRTGDLVRWLASGALEFIGRCDHQVKLRGYRIELGEIEQVLRARPDVGDAVVVTRALANGTSEGEHRLVGYVVMDRSDGSGIVELREHLESFLPRYMVPSDFVMLDALPLTKHGKVDRLALPDPDWARSRATSVYEPPRTTSESAVADIWGDLLNVERVSVHDDFFRLGGHSLLATQVVSRVRERLGVNLAIAKLFSNTTVAEFAGEIDTLLWAATGHQVSADGRSGVEGAL